MTVCVTDVLRRITPKWSSNCLDELSNKQVVLQRMYLMHKENAKILLKIFQVWKTTLAPHYIWYIQSNYGNKQNTWTKDTNLECSRTHISDIKTTPIYMIPSLSSMVSGTIQVWLYGGVSMSLVSQLSVTSQKHGTATIYPMTLVLGEIFPPNLTCDII